MTPDIILRTINTLTKKTMNDTRYKMLQLAVSGDYHNLTKIATRTSRRLKKSKKSFRRCCRLVATRNPHLADRTTFKLYNFSIFLKSANRDRHRYSFSHDAFL